jgi:hypothetical protein
MSLVNSLLTLPLITTTGSYAVCTIHHRNPPEPIFASQIWLGSADLDPVGLGMGANNTSPGCYYVGMYEPTFVFTDALGLKTQFYV